MKKDDFPKRRFLSARCTVFDGDELVQWRDKQRGVEKANNELKELVRSIVLDELKKLIQDGNCFTTSDNSSSNNP